MAEKRLNRCVIICGSPDNNPEFIKKQIRENEYVICADSGYLYARNAGIVPDLFIGDFDSFKGTIPSNIEIITLKTHKDDTDSMHCAEVALDRGYRDIVLLGATGGRLDHTFGNLSILQYLYNKGASAKIFNSDGYIEYISKGDFHFKELKNCTFSVFPFGCESVSVSYFGDVEYPADNLEIDSSAGIGISNIFRSDDVCIKINRGNALVFVLYNV